MIEIKQGNILHADAEALVNTVNCVGVMGRGIALQFRKAYPDNYYKYEQLCKRGELRPGRLFVYETGRLTNPSYIINFPTKKHWRGKSKLEYIDAGLEALQSEIRDRNIKSVAIPPLGCGLGGLNWEDVRPRIEQVLSEIPDLKLVLYVPSGAPRAEEMPKVSEKPCLTRGRAVLLALMHRYLAALMDPFVSLLEIHKLMYLMQEVGEDLRLRYSKGPYGPYATNLRHVLNLLEGHYVAGYADAEDNPEKNIQLKPDAAEKALEFLAAHPDTEERFHRVVDLVQGFETSFGMELLSTVHWVATKEGANSVERAAEATHDWNDRKQMFEPRHIEIAWEVLQSKGWLEAA